LGVRKSIISNEGNPYLGRDDEVVANPASFSPFADELLRRVVLAKNHVLEHSELDKRRTGLLVTSGIEEVTALLPESVEQLEATLFGHVAHSDRGPRRFADAHASELEWRNVDTCPLGELTKVTELRGGLLRRGEEGHCENRSRLVG
jgi:hypothetical protein